mgnify:CR=1 FL=1
MLYTYIHVGPIDANHSSLKCPLSHLFLAHYSHTYCSAGGKANSFVSCGDDAYVCRPTGEGEGVAESESEGESEGEGEGEGEGER